MWLVGGVFVPEGPSKKLAPMGFKEPVSHRVLQNLCNRNAVTIELHCCDTSFQIYKEGSWALGLQGSVAKILWLQQYYMQGWGCMLMGGGGGGGGYISKPSMPWWGKGHRNHATGEVSGHIIEGANKYTP